MVKNNNEYQLIFHLVGFPQSLDNLFLSFISSEISIIFAKFTSVNRTEQ